MNEEILTKQTNETSRLSGLGIEKFLMPNEMVTYATAGSLYVSNIPGLKGYVTKNRVMFYKQEGFIFKSDILNEIPMDQIKSYKLIEEGIIFKTFYFQLNELKIKGDRSDVLDLYRAIQTSKLK